MSQYKVLPSYTDLTSLHDFHQVPVLFSAQVPHVNDRLMDLDTSLQTVPLDMDQAGLVSSSTDAPYIFPWEHENVLTVQEALSSISSPGLTNPNLLEPVSCSVYGYEESSLDLSTTSPILTSYSFSPTSRDLVGGHLTSSQGRLVTLPPRNSLLDPLAGHHHLESQHLPPQHHMQHQHQQQMPSLASTSIKHEKERRVRARPRSLTEAKDIERPCKVCGERAGKHSYYGGQVCPSCRAFFRRSVQSGYNATYYCVKEGDCEVTLKTRKNCQYCRYRLCEGAGMKTTWVLTEEERKLKFAGKGKKRKDRVSAGGSVSVSETCGESPGTELGNNGTPGQMPVLGLCEADLADIQSYVAAAGVYEQSRVADMDTQLIRKIIRMIAFKATLDQDGQSQLRGVITSRCLKFVTKLEDYSRLPETDQALLVSSNLVLLSTLLTAAMFPPALLWPAQLAPLLGDGEVDKLNTKLRSLNVMGLDNMHLDFMQFFGLPSSLNVGDESLERFQKLLREIGSWHQDPTELVLLSLVIFFSSDMLDLSQRAAVEESQLSFVLLLQKYISIRHQSEPEVSRARFARGMMMVILVREMAVTITSTPSSSDTSLRDLDTLQEL